MTDEQVVLLADIASTGFSGAESGGVRDRRRGRRVRAGPDRPVRDGRRQADGRVARHRRRRRPGPPRDGASAWAPTSRSTSPQVDVVAEVKRLTGGGADVAIEALGTQETFENALRCLRPGGTLSSLGVYSGKLEMPYDAFAAGLGDHRIVTTLCPGGKERMRRLIATVQSGRFDPLPLITHRFALDDIVEAYDLFSNRRDGVLKVAIRP